MRSIISNSKWIDWWGKRSLCWARSLASLHLFTQLNAGSFCYVDKSTHFFPFLFRAQHTTCFHSIRTNTSWDCEQRVCIFSFICWIGLVRMCVTQKRRYQFRVVDVIWFTSVCTYLQMNFYHYYCKWAHVCVTLKMRWRKSSRKWDWKWNVAACNIARRLCTTHTAIATVQTWTYISFPEANRLIPKANIPWMLHDVWFRRNK